MSELLHTIPILMIAAFLHGALGFGFPLLSTPLLVLGMDMRNAILLTLVPTVTINLVSVLSEQEWKKAIREFWPIPTFTIVGSYLGTQLLFAFDPEIFRLLLAFSVIAYLVTEQMKGARKERYFPRWALALFGLTLGLMAGVVNVFSPLIVIFALETRVRPQLLVPVFNISFLTSKSGQIAGFISQGEFHGAALTFSLLILPLVLLSLWFGIRRRKQMHEEGYRKLLRWALWVIALFLIAQATSALWLS